MPTAAVDADTLLPLNRRKGTILWSDVAFAVGCMLVELFRGERRVFSRARHDGEAQLTHGHRDCLLKRPVRDSSPTHTHTHTHRHSCACTQRERESACRIWLFKYGEDTVLPKMCLRSCFKRNGQRFENELHEQNGLTSFSKRFAGASLVSYPLHILCMRLCNDWIEH